MLLAQGDTPWRTEPVVVSGCEAAGRRCRVTWPGSRSDVGGEVAPGFEAVREAFARRLADGVERGAAGAAFQDGRMVVDLWAGTVRSDSLVHLYSVTKPLAAACALWLVDRGVLELDARVAALWPEYGQAGKQDTTLRHLLSHQAGLLGWRAAQPLEALLDHDRAAELLAAGLVAAGDRAR